MADTIRDPFDDSEDDEIGKPPTPEIHHGDDVGCVDSPDPPGFSDISDNEDKDTKEDAAPEDSEENLSRVNSPSVDEVEPRKDPEEIENHQGSNSPGSNRNSSPVSPISEEGNGETVGRSSLSKPDESSHTPLMQQEVTLESEEATIETNRTFDEQEKTYEDEAIEKGDGEYTEKDDGQRAEKDDGKYDEKAVTGEPVEKDFGRNSGEINMETEKTDSRRRRISSGGGTDDDLEMPISPLGLGLSGPESEIFDDILKSDVSKLLPDIREESAEKPAGNDEDINQDDEERAIPQPDQTEEDDEGSEAGEQLIADIFGASDEEEEFEGFGQEDIEVTKKKKGAREKRHHLLSNDEEEEKAAVKEAPMTVPKPKTEKANDDSDEDDDFNDKPVFVSDFDLMIQKKKEINRTFRRKRKNFDIINDSDDLIAHMIKQMKDVVEEDRILNGAKQAATKKLKMLPSVLKHLNKADLQMTFLDLGVLPVLKDWLSPLPDGSLPHLQIREGLLKVLNEFPTMDTGSLKMSGLGKAVMYLYRHPKETRQNKEIAGKLINDWARPIFGVTSNFKSLSREEREERDYQNMSKRRRLSSVDSDGGRTPKSIDSALQSEKKPVRPGDKGFVMRARVPMPSNKDYVVRPQNNIERLDFSKKPQKMMNRFEKQKRKYDEKKKLLNRGAQRAVDISIEGRKMAL